MNRLFLAFNLNAILGMNSINRTICIISLAVFWLSNVQCNRGSGHHKELLIGDWILIGEQWHPGFRMTKDSIFPLLEQNGFLSVRQNYGEPYELLKDDSLTFGPPDYIENQWGINKDFRGFWKINKLTKDSLTVEDDRGEMNFYKRSI